MASREEISSKLHGFAMDGPTDQRLKGGDFELLQVEKGGPRVAVEVSPTPYHKAYNRGKLNHKQLKAAEWFESAYVILSEGSMSSGRNILDVSPRGSVLTDLTPTQLYIHLKGVMAKVEARLRLETIAENDQRYKRLIKRYNRLPAARRARKPPRMIGMAKVGKFGQERYNVIRSVCAHSELIGDMRPSYRRYSLLCEGLNIVADVVFDR